MPNSFPEGMIPEIERILSQHHNWPPGMDSYDELFASPLFFPLQRRRELEAMMRRCRQIQPETVAVIGSDKGSDLFHFVKCLPTVRRAIACEIRGTPYADAFKQYFPKVEFLFLPVGSRERSALSQVRDFLDDGKINCLFIDGDKSRFTEDFNAYLPFMAPGGLVLMHDICCPPNTASCLDAFNEAGKTHRTETIIDMSEYDEDREAVKRGERVKSSYGQWLRYWSQYPTCGVGVINV